MEKVLTISEITEIIKNVLEDEDTLQNVWLEGEISDFVRHASGHIYFTLKDEGSQIRAVMFRAYAVSAAEMELANGMHVVVFGSVGVYEKRGEYQFYVRSIRPAGIGALYLKFEQLKKKLKEEGLFDEARKKRLPEFPWKIAVCTSPTGAAIRDVLSVIERRFPAVEVVIVPTVVQGEETARSVVSSLEAAQNIPDVSLILLVRGGGSIQDLWGFNEEIVARAIARRRVPVVSGVGHETDYTIADFVADVRAPTPSAAAEMSVPSLEEVKSRIARAVSVLTHSAQSRIDLRRAFLGALTAVLTPRRFFDIVRQRQQMIDERIAAAEMTTRHRMEGLHHKTTSLMERLESLDPSAVLSRGYSLCYDAATGMLLRTVSQVRPHQRLKTVLADGSFYSTAESIEVT
ncbi:MAG: exodeoxyribonuclease VII large subunit [bacterium]